MKKSIITLSITFLVAMCAMGQSVLISPSSGSQHIITTYDSNTPYIITQRANGTAASPTAIQNNQGLFILGARGHNGVNFSNMNNASITFASSQTHAPGAFGGYMFFSTIENNNQITRERMRISHNGNVGIGTTTPGFPLNFSDLVGDKISLFGQSGNHFGLGINNNLMMIHTDVAGSDIAFGHGAFGAFTETIRIKGNGNLGIGTNDPQAKLQVNGTSILSNIPGQGEQVLIGESFSPDSKVSIKSNGYTYALKVEGSGSTAVGLAVLGGASVEGNSMFGNNLTVLQAFTAQGSATFDGTSNFNNNATFNAPAAFNQNVSIQNLSVNNITPTAAAVNILGNLSTANNSEVNGFSKLGSDSPSIKVKKLTGTTANSQGGSTPVLHGLTRSKILSVSVLVDDGTFSNPPNLPLSGYEFYFDITNSNINIYNSSTSSSNILSKPFTILVTYEE